MVKKCNRVSRSFSISAIILCKSLYHATSIELRVESIRSITVVSASWKLEHYKMRLWLLSVLWEFPLFKFLLLLRWQNYVPLALTDTFRSAQKIIFNCLGLGSSSIDSRSSLLQQRRMDLPLYNIIKCTSSPASRQTDIELNNIIIIIFYSSNTNRSRDRKIDRCQIRSHTKWSESMESAWCDYIIIQRHDQTDRVSQFRVIVSAAAVLRIRSVQIRRTHFTSLHKHHSKVEK